MSDNTGNGSTGVGTATPASTTDGGIIDVSGMTFDELSSAIGTKDLGRALDYILGTGQNGTGYHGFNSRI
jgi:hypothetical protein